ncbi:MAG: hypothetical protein WDO06_07415 [Actinomycetota bacterium]
MRCYIAVEPKEIEELFHSGTKVFSEVLVLPNAIDGDTELDDVEESEFELSLLAARDSQQRQHTQGKKDPRGYVLAVELGSIPIDQLHLEQRVAWREVDSILVADSDEDELSWYAPQEVEIFLPNWLA